MLNANMDINRQLHLSLNTIIILLTLFAGVNCSDGKAKTFEDLSASLVQHVRTLPSSEYDYDSHDYYTSLLQLALSKTEAEYGKAELTYIEEKLVQSRIIKDLSGEGSIDVFWTVTSQEREESAIPVRVPLLNGIMGLRVSLILKKRIGEFSFPNINEPLTEMVAGQGHDWPDYHILHSNGFLVLGTSTYDMLVELLKKKRIDYFPRALNEAIVEREALESSGVIIEPNHIFYYPSYIFFFVSQSKPELAERLEKGLNLAIQDGSFAQLFNAYIEVDKLSSELNLQNRTMFRLHNPLLSEETQKFSKSFNAISYLQRTER